MHELEPSPRQANIIGIDLGTEFTTVARFNEAGRAEITNNSEGGTQTPSVIQIDESGEVIVGTEAKKFLGTGSPGVFGEFKRGIGTDKSWSVGERSVTPTDLTAILLKRVVADYAEQFGQPTTIAITWPANFSGDAREATKVAARMAGLRNVYFIEDPTAAALYYAADTPLNGKYLAFDLGQTSLDITLIKVSANRLTILHQGGVQAFGLKDIDRAILKAISDKYRSVTASAFDVVDCNFDSLSLKSVRQSMTCEDQVSVEVLSTTNGHVGIKIYQEELERRLNGNSGALHTEHVLRELIAEELYSHAHIKINSITPTSLKTAVEKALITLTPRNRTCIRMVSGSHGPVAIEINGVEFEAAISSLLEQAKTTLESILRCGQDAPKDFVKKSDIKGVFMIGRGAKLHAFQVLIKKMFGRHPRVREPERAKALGAAIYATLKTDKSWLNALQASAASSWIDNE